MKDPFSLIIFGITGNLAQIKLIPALYDLESNNFLPEKTKIIGVSRQETSKESLLNYVDKVLHMENRHHVHAIDKEVENRLLKKISHLDGNLSDVSTYRKLAKQTSKNNIFYLATYPSLYETIFSNLRKADLGKKRNNWPRVVVEKPIGSNFETSRKLNKVLTKYFVEDQIYRLDHYLGKETLQNILTFRFGNGIFEPLLNKDYLDSIQVTASEDFGVDKRGGYYDSVGAIRDVGQNHIVQMIALSTMEHPINFTNHDITRKRIELINSLSPVTQSLVVGQYKGYLNEPNVDPSSSTETFFALKAFIKNDRFKGVPIYIRAGKKLERTITEISFRFKVPQNRLFAEMDKGMQPNELIFRIQPSEGIVVKILTKTPGHTQEIQPTYMQFCYKQLGSPLIDPYERLIIDVLKGDQTFFIDADEVESQWQFTDPLVSARKKPIIYKPGTWGPKEAEKVAEEDGKSWIDPSTEFCLI